MATITRKTFLTVLGTGAAGSLLRPGRSAAHSSSTTPYGTRIYQGSNLAGWQMVVGDGGTPGQQLSDIEDVHYDEYSELRANIQHNPYLSAHNITYHQILDETAFQYVHVCEYQFRLPYMPAIGNTDMNAQTIEGGLSLWDGQTRLKHEVLFQWILNPYWRFGDLQSWTGTTRTLWQGVESMTPDLEWHQQRIVADFQRETSSLSIDGLVYPSCIGISEGPSDWGAESAATIQCEIISIDPGEQGVGALHIAHFKNWVWTWEPASTCKIFLPSVVR